MLSRAHIFNQLFATEHNGATVQIEEWKTCPRDSLRDISCLAKQQFDLRRPEMFAMPYMFVEGGHGTAGSRDDERAPRTHVLASTPQQAARIVHVLDHLRAYSVRRPATQVFGWEHLLQQIALYEPRIRYLLPGDFHARLTQFKSHNFSQGEGGADSHSHVTLATTDIEQSDARP
jgi:hypothetical protein